MLLGRPRTRTVCVLEPKSGSEKLSVVDGVCLGIEIASFVDEVERCLHKDRGVFPRIELRLLKTATSPMLTFRQEETMTPWAIKKPQLCQTDVIKGLRIVIGQAKTDKATQDEKKNHGT